MQTYSRTDLGAFYTSELVSKLLVDSMGISNPQSIIDLGSGGFALSRAAMNRWSSAQLITVDCISSSSCKLDWRDGISHRHFQADALDVNLHNYIDAPHGHGFDAVLSNPPYINPRWRQGFRKIFEASGLSEAVGLRGNVSADIVFLAQAIRLLRHGGHAGLIVPDGIIAGSRNKAVRKALVEQHLIHQVISLPRRSFIGTDAKAHILLFQKGISNSEGRIPIRRLTLEGQLSRPIYVDPAAAVQRMDYEFHQQRIDEKNIPGTTSELHKHGCQIFRGKINAAESKILGNVSFHTSDFPTIPGEIDGLAEKEFYNRLREFGHNCSVGTAIAKPDDVLVGRVGRNIDKQVALVRTGHFTVSDCVFIIRLPSPISRVFFSSLSSEAGSRWIRANLQGVAAQYITKNHLSNYPLPVI